MPKAEMYVNAHCPLVHKIYRMENKYIPEEEMQAGKIRILSTMFVFLPKHIVSLFQHIYYCMRVFKLAKTLLQHLAWKYSLETNFNILLRSIFKQNFTELIHFACSSISGSISTLQRTLALTCLILQLP